MPAFTVSTVARDVHTRNFVRPPLECGFEYQIPPCKEILNTQLYQADIEGPLMPGCLSFAFSNVSLLNYKHQDQVNNLFTTLRCGSERINLDFTQLTIDNHNVVEKIIGGINNLQKNCNYQLLITITIPVNNHLVIPDTHLSIIYAFLDQFISIGMINILITKDLKYRQISWLGLVEKAFKNAKEQLLPIFANNSAFPGHYVKYLGLVLDGDITPESFSSVKTTVRQTLIHGANKNISENELVNIWRWIVTSGGGQLTLKSYPSNFKQLNSFLQNNFNILKLSRPLPLPQNMMDILLAEESDLPQYDASFELGRVPTYKTVSS